MKQKISLFVLLIATVVVAAFPALAQTDAEEGPVARAVMFFSPTCGHCELVIQEHLPVIFDQYGGEPRLFFDETLPPGEVAFYEMTNGTLDLLLVDVTVQAGADFFEADTERLAVPDEMMGVPRLDVDEIYLVGSADIPSEFPVLIEAGLAAGGIPWPAIPGINDAIAAVPGMADRNQPIGGAGGDEAAGTLPSAGDESVFDRIANDPVGNGIAILVLVAMLISIVAVPVLVQRGILGGSPVWVVPALAVVGMAVSAYLGTVEASGTEAVCGPVGDCNAVQQSAYASIFGIHIGIVGIVGYAALLISWIVSKAWTDRVADRGAIVAAVIAFGGTLFSIYLTFLEPFVIGATCMWCIASAITITGLLWTTASPGWTALGRIRGSEQSDPPSERGEPSEAQRS